MVTEDLSLPIESNLLEIVALILLSKNGRSLLPEVWFPTYLNNQDAVFKGDYHLPTSGASSLHWLLMLVLWESERSPD